MQHTRSANHFAQLAMTYIPLVGTQRETCEAVLARSYDAVRDSLYGAVDMPKMLFKANSGYGDYMRYTRQMRKHGKVNPDDFKDIDTNQLRMYLEHHYNSRGPLQNINYQYFNYMYIVMGAVVLYVAYGLNQQLQERLDKNGFSDDRINAFSDTHED